MTGYLVWREGSWCIRYYEEEICGVPLWRAELPASSSPSRRQRLMQRAASTLRRHGVTRFLGEPLCGIPGISTGPLWRAMAAPAALSLLDAHHIPHARAFVALRGERVDRSIITCCTALAPQVRGLALEIPDSDALAWRLQRQFGLPILASGGDLTLCFSGVPDGIDLRGDTPCPEGLRLLCPAQTLPEDCPQTPLLAYLLEQGAIHLSDLAVSAEFPISPAFPCLSTEIVV